MSQVLWLLVLSLIATTAQGASENPGTTLPTIVFAVDESGSTDVMIGAQGDILGEATAPVPNRRDQIMHAATSSIIRRLAEHHDYPSYLAVSVVTWGSMVYQEVVPPTELSQAATILNQLDEYESLPRHATNMAYAIDRVFEVDSTCTAIVVITDQYTKDEELSDTIKTVTTHIPVGIFVIPDINLEQNILDYTTHGGDPPFFVRPLTVNHLETVIDEMITHIMEQQCPMM